MVKVRVNLHKMNAGMMEIILGLCVCLCLCEIGVVEEKGKVKMSNCLSGEPANVGVLYVCVCVGLSTEVFDEVLSEC